MRPAIVRRERVIAAAVVVGTATACNTVLLLLTLFAYGVLGPVPFDLFPLLLVGQLAALFGLLWFRPFRRLPWGGWLSAACCTAFASTAFVVVWNWHLALAAV